MGELRSGNWRAAWQVEPEVWELLELLERRAQPRESEEESEML